MVDRALKGRDVLSVPKVTLIIRDFVKLQEFPELLLERSFPMVFLLALDFDELVFTVSATLATVNVRESPKNKWT